MMLKKYDKPLAVLFGFLTLVFLVIAFTNKDFLDWAFARHHNQLSWYIRPLFILPFCYFAYKRSLAGISVTIFCLLTSMFWFPEPNTVSNQVKDFLQFEVDYLTGEWGIGKILITSIVPISLTALAVAFWKRNVMIGLTVIVFIALGKMGWSVIFAGESGKSIMIPAISGLMICVGLVYWGIKRSQKKSNITH
ncbi:hypothetical protein ACFYKX_12535 [Cytobacillus sp. FJAT-54145]|uniref:Uncharacterized protein n=1 Tax=Cytobacillus spartinae TaxID=3299023 RepID=A0ABW6KCG3_9BACI